MMLVSLHEHSHDPAPPLLNLLPYGMSSHWAHIIRLLYEAKPMYTLPAEGTVCLGTLYNSYLSALSFFFFMLKTDRVHGVCVCVCDQYYRKGVVTNTAGWLQLADFTDFVLTEGK